MKFIFHFFTFLSVFVSFAQDAELFQVSPHWKVGDIRKVHTDVSTKVIYDGVLVSNQRKVYDIQLRVLSTDDQFILNYSSFDRLESVLNASEDDAQSSVQQKLRSFLRDAEMEIGKSDLTVQVNKETGVALAIKNGIEVSKKVEFETRKKLREWASAENNTEQEIRSLEIELSKRFEEMYPKIQQQILDKTTAIFAPYNVAFPMNKTITQNVKTHDVTAASKSDSLFPAVMKMESVEVNNKMVVKTSLDYDKVYLLEQLKKSYSKLEGVKADEVSIIEKEEIMFDLTTSWLMHHITNLHFEIPGMKTITKSSVTFL